MRLIKDDELERNERISGAMFATIGGLRAIKDMGIVGNHEWLAEELDELILSLEVVVDRFQREAMSASETEGDR